MRESRVRRNYSADGNGDLRREGDCEVALRRRGRSNGDLEVRESEGGEGKGEASESEV